MVIVNLILLSQLREDLKKGVYVENLREYNVRTVNDVVKLLLQVWIFGELFGLNIAYHILVIDIIGIILSYTGCCKQKNGGNSYEQWEQPFPQCFYLYHWEPLGERFHESFPICEVKFSRSSGFWKVTIVSTISCLFILFYKASPTAYWFRQKSSGAEGDRLKEAANINKSLSTLG